MELTKCYLKMHKDEVTPFICVFTAVVLIQLIIVQMVLGFINAPGGSNEIISLSIYINLIVFIFGIAYTTKYFRIAMGVVGDRKHYSYSIMIIALIILVVLPGIHYITGEGFFRLIEYTTATHVYRDNVLGLEENVIIGYILFAVGILLGAIYEKIGFVKFLKSGIGVFICFMGTTLINIFLLNKHDTTTIWYEEIIRYMLEYKELSMIIAIIIFFLGMKILTKVDIRKLKSL